MKQVFRCDFCTEIGTAEEIMKHEENCICNYHKKSCLTCKHAKRNITTYFCEAGRDIPEGKYIENCSTYEYDGRNHATRNIFNGSSLFGGLFG
jgi:hypothetical protein